MLVEKTIIATSILEISDIFLALKIDIGGIRFDAALKLFAATICSVHIISSVEFVVAFNGVFSILNSCKVIVVSHRFYL